MTLRGPWSKAERQDRDADASRIGGHEPDGQGEFAGHAPDELEEQAEVPRPRPNKIPRAPMREERQGKSHTVASPISG